MLFAFYSWIVKFRINPTNSKLWSFYALIVLSVEQAPAARRKQPGQSTPEEVGLNTFIKGLKECAATCTVKDDVDLDKAGPDIFHKKKIVYSPC